MNDLEQNSDNVSRMQPLVVYSYMLSPHNLSASETLSIIMDSVSRILVIMQVTYYTPTTQDGYAGLILQAHYPVNL